MVSWKCFSLVLAGACYPAMALRQAPPTIVQNAGTLPVEAESFSGSVPFSASGSGSAPRIVDVEAELIKQKSETASAKATAERAEKASSDTLKKLDQLRSTLRNAAVSHTEALRKVQIPPPRLAGFSGR